MACEVASPSFRYLTFLSFYYSNNFLIFAALNRVKMGKTEELIEKIKKVHGDNVDTSKVEYISYTTKICLICHKKDKYGNEHGEYWQVPNSCLRGATCPKCANERRGKKPEERMTTEKYILREREVHGDKYDLSNAVYVDANTKMCFICPKHGEFWMMPYSHLSGQGCPKCAGRGLTTEDIIERFKEENPRGDYYIYTEVDFKNMDTPVCIICPKHGKFWQKPSKHLKGHGCPECGLESKNKSNTYTFEEIVEKANRIHNKKYKYLKTDTNGIKSDLYIICPIHGLFIQKAEYHLNGHGCSRCGNNMSVAEDEIIKFIKEDLGIDNVMQRNKKIIAPQELDIYLPDYNLAIEYDGVIWHSEKFGKDKNYHIDKLKKCNDKGICLINIFEDEYNDKKEIVYYKLRYLIGKDCDKDKVYASKCVVREISKNEAKIFLEKNHIQGYVPSTVYLGSFLDGTLVGVMSFKKASTENKWELNRFATGIAKHYIGLEEDLFIYFVSNYNPNEVKSFADRRWTIHQDNNLYTRLGFKLDSILKPDYSYVTSKSKRIPKSSARKNLLIKRYPDCNLTNDMTESEMTSKLGFYKIWDCGKLKYVWRKEN